MHFEMDKAYEEEIRKCIAYREKRYFWNYDPFKYLDFNFMYSYIDEENDIAGRIAKKLNVKYLDYVDDFCGYPFHGIVDEEISLCFINFPCRIFHINPDAKLVNIIFLIEPASVKSYLTDKAIKALVQNTVNYTSQVEDIGFYKEKNSLILAQNQILKVQILKMLISWVLLC